MDSSLNGKYGASDEDADFPQLDGAEAKDLGLALSPETGEILDIGEINAQNWREYEDIATNSLWIIGARSREGAHTGKYHGNFVPQIPYQAIRRFTKPGDVVLDVFLGSGTTLIESRRLGRHGIGIELIDSIAAEAKELIDAADNPHHTWQEVIQGDSAAEETIDKVRQALASQDLSKVQLVLMHPPYHDIIKFSDDPLDLCNAPTVLDFLETFKKVVYRTYDLLESNHFLVVVIGDKYGNGQWVPLGFKTMEAVQSVGYTLKSIVVKNMEGNRAKRNLQNLWRQRAFRGGYYIFKHEYVFFFQKTGEVVEYLEKLRQLVMEIDDRAEDEGLIEKGSFASGEVLGDLISRYSWISPARILALKKGRAIRAIVVDCTDIKINSEARNELQDLIENKPDTVITFSILAERDKRTTLQEIPGVSQVYSPDEYSLEQLAHTLYIVRKAIGFDQRAGRLEGVTFAADISRVLEDVFELDVDYAWRQKGGGIGFKFFKKQPDLAFEAMQAGQPNFQIGLETKWVSGHENEKAPQIRDKFYNKGYELIVIIGHNVKSWQSAVRNRGNFANYYLLLGKKDRKSLQEILQNKPLLKACGDKGVEEINLSLIDFLKSRKLDLEPQPVREQNESQHP